MSPAEAEALRTGLNALGRDFLTSVGEAMETWRRHWSRPPEPSLDEIVRLHVEGHRKAVPGSVLMYQGASRAADMYPDTSSKTAAPKRRRKRKSKKA